MSAAPMTVSIARDVLDGAEPPSGDDTTRCHAIVEAAQRQATIMLAASGSLRRYNAWVSPEEMLLQAYAVDPSQPMAATIVPAWQAPVALAALARLDGELVDPRVGNAEELTFADTDRFIESVVTGSAGIGEDAKGVVVGLLGAGGRYHLVAWLNAPDTRWGTADPGEPLTLRATSPVGLISALAPLFEPLE